MSVQSIAQTRLEVWVCIVLIGWSLLPNTLRYFWYLLCFQNLGFTRKWICWLKFAQRPIFSGLWFFNEPEISDSDLCSGFLRPEKSMDLSRISTREPWISRRARYPETTEADYEYLNIIRMNVRVRDNLQTFSLVIMQVILPLLLTFRKSHFSKGCMRVTCEIFVVTSRYISKHGTNMKKICFQYKYNYLC